MKFSIKTRQWESSFAHNCSFKCNILSHPKGFFQFSVSVSEYNVVSKADVKTANCRITSSTAPQKDLNTV